MALKGKKPEITNGVERFKLMVYGDAGVGKTLAVTKIPNNYIIDSESGTKKFKKSILESNSSVLFTSSFDDVLSEVKELSRVKDHGFTTLTIDSISVIYASVQEKFPEDTYWAKIKKEWRKLMLALYNVDMNIILIAHEKPEYAEGKLMVRIGSTYDAMKDDDHVFDYQLRIIPPTEGSSAKDYRAGYKPMAVVIKERAELNEWKFPAKFEWSYESLSKFIGTDCFTTGSKPVNLATPDQLTDLKKMIEILNTPQESIDKWLTKEKVDTLEEMTTEQIQVYIDAGRKKIAELEK